MKKGLTVADKRQIIQDFKEWSGGFTFDQYGLDELAVYITNTLSTKYDSNQVNEWIQSIVETNNDIK
jgi:hypothetical protein